MQIISSFQLLKGYKADEPTYGSVATSLIQPLQMLPYEDKNDEWRIWNMNWLERQGMEQLRLKYNRLTKNYRLANGILDKSDYIIEETNENKELIDVLSRDNDPTGLSELKFFPIIPNVIDLLVGEFLKRNNKVIAWAVDEFSRNEKLDKKKELVDEIISQQAAMDLLKNLSEQGAELTPEEMQQMMSPENIQSLPDVERFMRKNYRTTIEQWCSHQINCDRLRFRMDEQEARGFRDSLVTDQEFWEIVMLENDYLPRLLDPRQVFFHKAPGKRYVSEGNFAGYIELMTISDVIDMYGYKMTEDEIHSLQTLFPDRNVLHLLNLPNDGSYYDINKSYEENVRNGSLQYKQLMAFEDTFGSRRGIYNPYDYLSAGADENVLNRYMLRVTTGYWKSQKKVGHLTKIDEFGQITQAIVSEDYEITDEPEYDNSFTTDDTKDNLVFGEDIEWIWINEVWGGIKIGRNLPSTAIQGSVNGETPIYLGIGNKKKPDRLAFQFKSNSSLYNAPLPIEGIIFSDRTHTSMSMVDRMKPFQVSYNMVNNKISDILIDELGTVIVIDQNMLPQHSLGESWGKNNLAKAYTAMKNFQILPLDTSLQNTETPTHFNNLTKLDASQTERLLGLVQLSTYFRAEALASIGVTMERMGIVNAQQTATGTQASVNNSYAQTEKYFVQHSDFLMPRVWELMLSASQYFNSSDKRSSTLAYRNDKDEEIIFELPDAMDFLPRDVDVYSTTSFDRKELKKKLEQLAMENNTSGATIYDLGRILTLDTPSEVLEALKDSEVRMQKQRQEEAQYEQQLQQQQVEAAEREKEAQRQFEAAENEKDRQADLAKESMRQHSTPDNGNDDMYRQQEFNAGQAQHADDMQFKREQEANRNVQSQQQADLERQKLITQQQVSNNQLAIARENKNQADLKARQKAQEAKKKKK